MISHALMNGADEVRPAVVELEREIAVWVGFGTSGLLHPLAELDEYDIIIRCGLLGRAVGYGAS